MYEEEVQWDKVNKESWELRNGFITKVYGILLSQLLLTAAVVYTIFKVEALQDYLIENIWVYILCICLVVTTLIAMFCFHVIGRTVPWNYIMLFIFTVSEAVLIGVFCANFHPVTIFIAVVMTLQVTVVLTIYAFTTKSDFTIGRAMLAVVAMTAIMFFLMMGLFYRTSWLAVLMSGVFCIIYGLYIVIDTQSIIANHKYSVDVDDYIIGSLCLYVDIAGLFIYLLALLGAFTKN
mmetsp:Transcript_18434/g.33207  ORF Transcript_18434/g.33207 Transcript_18434/m.33207 type:complete len:235 (+) Transcript_18434:374-1078(+)